MGQTTYSSRAAARAASIPAALPPEVQPYGLGKLVGKVIAAKNGTTLETSSPFTTTFTSSIANQHSDLSERDAANSHPATAISVTGGETLQAYLDSLSSSPSFETVSKNLKGYPYILNYSAGVLSSIVYNVGGGNYVTKTLNYTTGNLTSIVLSGATPGGILLTKTLSYSGGSLSSISYS
jgi:hypothetical protein